MIGAGGAGLTATWLLEQQHDVTLYEVQDRLGGHAHTVDIEVDGRSMRVDAGFQFFGPGRGYATFNRLLDALGIRRSSYAATMSLTRTPERRSVALPPSRAGRPVWSSLTPGALADLIRFRRFLVGIPSFLERRDTTVTTEEYITALRMPASFTDRFLYPLLLALWCVDLPTLHSFAAYNTLHYFSEALSDGFHPPTQLQIDGGVRAYVDKLVHDLQRAQVRTATGAVRLERHDDEYVIQDAVDSRESFDHIVIATNAQQAAELLRSMDGLEAVTEQLDRVEYFDTTIAVHGDRRLMPPRRGAWSVVNARWDGEHSHLSVWDPALGLDVFRSWVTYDTQPPEPLYATVTYRHGKITPAYFDAQRRLKDLNGVAHVWIAGLYMHDTDSHESAIRSAVAVARRLAPESERLALLDSFPGKAKPPRIEAPRGFLG